MPFTDVTVTATYTRPNGTPATGDVEFVLQNAMADGAGEIVARGQRATAVLNSAGTISQVLQANTDPTTSPQGTVWQVTERIDGGPRTWLLSVPHTAPTLNLATVAPALSGQPAYAYVLQSALTAHAATPHGGQATLPATSTPTAGEALSGHRAVTFGAGGQVVYADNATVAHKWSPIGVTLAAAASGAPVSVAWLGQVTEPGWAWTPGSPVWLGAAGVLTQALPVAPAASFIAQIGIAATPTTIFVDPRVPVSVT